MANNLSLQRMNRITGSRIAGVLGISPYHSRAEVMREMVREHYYYDPEFTGNFITEWGSEHETHAVVDYELHNPGVKLLDILENQKTWVGGPNESFAVTPDGLVIPKGEETPRGILETKCPWRARYTSIWERPDYEAQERLILETLDLEFADTCVWREEGSVITRLYRDKDRDGNDFAWLPSVMPEIEKFLEEYSGYIDRDPEEPEVAQFLTGRPGMRIDEAWLRAAATYLDTRYEFAVASAALDAAKRDLQELAGNETAKGAGVQVIYRKPTAGGKGAVSYKKATEALAAKLEQLGHGLPEDYLDEFRGAPTGGGSATYAFKLIDES